MSSDLELIRIEMKDLILNTCNMIGCDNCHMKWTKDDDGNSCRSDYLMMKEYEAEKAK